jgi:hypothetical protein
MKLILLFILALTTAALAQPTFRINTLVGRSELTAREKSDVEEYAAGWAEALNTKDAAQLIKARRQLIDPIDERWHMTEVVRTIYGRSLRRAFEPLLDQSNDNQMAAVNALQVLSMLGTEQSLGVLMRHADINAEPRSAVRHWASIGLGRVLSSGRLPMRRIRGNAQVVADGIAREPEWYVISRQFDALASLPRTQGLSRVDREALRKLSLNLQADAVIALVAAIAENDEPDERMQAARASIASLRLQLMEPSLDSAIRRSVLDSLSPTLVELAGVIVEQGDAARSDDTVRNAYGGTLEIIGVLMQHQTGKDQGDLRAAWNNGDSDTIMASISSWPSSESP